MPLGLIGALFAATMCTAFFIMIIFEWNVFKGVFKNLFKKKDPEQKKKANPIVKFLKILTILYGFFGGAVWVLFYSVIGITLDQGIFYAFTWAASIALGCGIIAVIAQASRIALMEKEIKKQEKQAAIVTDTPE